MLLAVDVGNTNIVLGCLEDGKVICLTRMETDRDKTAHEYAIALDQALKFGNIDPNGMEGAILSSVVPPINGALRAAIRMVTGRDAIVVGPGMKTGLNIGLDDPGTMASDLVVGAAAALNIHEPPLIIIDMGTATTISAIDGNKNFLGGMIIPGLRVSLDSLTTRTSQLPKISLDPPKRVIGSNTIDCMRSGIIYSNASSIDGVVEKIEEEIGEQCTVISTGGLAKVIIPYCKRKIIIDDQLLLKGLMIIYNKNR